MGHSGDKVEPSPVVPKVITWKFTCSPSSWPSVDLSVAKRSSVYCQEQPRPRGEAGQRGRLNDEALGTLLTKQAQEPRRKLGLKVP